MLRRLVARRRVDRGRHARANGAAVRGKYRGGAPRLRATSALEKRRIRAISAPRSRSQPTMIEAKRLGHVAFTTPDLALAIEYYTQVVGLVVTSRDAHQAYLSTRLGQLAVELNVGSEA